jgi:DNA (cytosine-5)-methyltransferase 1
MRLGFEEIGGRCVFTSEWDKYCQETYRLNFPDTDHEIAGDIRAVKENEIPDHDVLLAGFPCQPFSIAGVSKKNALGRPHGFDCTTQGTLFFDIERIIRAKRPKAFLLENVKNLPRHDGGRTFNVILQVLREKLGYYVPEPKVISSEAWVPQKRERIFIAGFRERCGFTFDNFQVPPTQHTLGEILERPDNVEKKYTLTAHLWKYLRDYKKKHQDQGNGFGCSVFGRDEVARTLSARYYKDGSEILIRQKGKRPRRLTPRECARLMGFDYGDRVFRIEVSDTQAYKQFGNAVVVPVVTAVARHMENHIRAAVKAGKSHVRRDRPKTIPLPFPASLQHQYG